MKDQFDLSTLTYKLATILLKQNNVKGKDNIGKTKKDIEFLLERALKGGGGSRGGRGGHSRSRNRSGGNRDRNRSGGGSRSASGDNRGRSGNRSASRSGGDRGRR